MQIQILSLLFLALLNSCKTDISDVDNNQPEYSIIKRHSLPTEVQETSGLIMHRGLVWTFNDSGGKPWIYGFNLRNDILEQVITLKNTINRDWEEITQDSTHIYIGDFGNNQGTRDSLIIYKFAKKAVPGKGNGEVTTEKIIFTYPEYKPVSVPFGFSSFDCEAFVSFGDSLFLFTKDWTSGTSTIYSLPKSQGRYLAKKVKTLNTSGLITGATLQDKSLVLVGYSSFVPFILRYPIKNIHDINDKNAKRYELSDIATYQTEGICFDGSSLLISSEATRSPAQIIELKLK